MQYFYRSFTLIVECLCVKIYANYLQELFTPVIETLITVGSLLTVGIDRVLEPFLEQVSVLLQNQELTENCVGLQSGKMSDESALVKNAGNQN